MKIKPSIPPATLNAVTALLAPYVPDVSATSLVEALQAFNAGDPAPVAATRPLTRKQAAEMLQMHVTSVNRLLNNGTLRRLKITGRSVRIDRASVEALLAGEAATANGEG
jgi:excisionase family DNA binding protein